MVAGGHGNDAAPAFGVREGREFGKRAALLERIGDLEVLVLHVHRRAGKFGEARRRQHGRAQHVAGDDAPRGFDMVERDAHASLERHTSRGWGPENPKSPPGRSTNTTISSDNTTTSRYPMSK